MVVLSITRLHGHRLREHKAFACSCMRAVEADETAVMLNKHSKDANTCNRQDFASLTPATGAQ